jgi:hypothetical protein
MTVEEKKLAPLYAWVQYKGFRLMIRPDERHGKEAIYCEVLESPNGFCVENESRCLKRRSFNFQSLAEMKTLVNALISAIKKYEKNATNTQ